MKTPIKKAIVTGGLGFIGSHLVEKLILDGIPVVVLDNESTGRKSNLKHLPSQADLTIHKVDIAEGVDPSFLKGATHLFHLAALADIVPSIDNPVKYYRANVDGTMNVMEAVRQRKDIRVVYAASSSCYGIPKNYPTPETEPISPQYPYALTKFLGEQTALHWGQVYHIPVVSTRFFNVYGPRARTSGTYGAVFGVFLAQKLNNKPLTIVGDGEQTRDFTHVKDVVNAVVTVATSTLSNEILNIGTGHPVSVNKIAKLIGGPTTFIPKRPGEPDCTHADISKIQKLLGWEAHIPLEEGVNDLLSRISDFKDAPVWTPESIETATKTWFEHLSTSS